MNRRTSPNTWNTSRSRTERRYPESEPTSSLPSVRESREDQLEKWNNYRRLTPSKYKNEGKASDEPEVAPMRSVAGSSHDPALTQRQKEPAQKASPSKGQQPSIQEEPSRSRRPAKGESAGAVLKPALSFAGPWTNSASVATWKFLFHLLFLAVVCIIAFGMINPIMYYYSHALHKLFTSKVYHNDSVPTVTFDEIKSVPEFWTFAKTTFLTTLFMDFDTEKDLNHFEDKLSILECMVVGQTRIRQVRVRNDSCTVSPDFERLFDSCYGYYSSKNEDKDPFGKGAGTGWSYCKESELDSRSYEGQISTYGGGGYYVDLYKNYEESNRSLNDLWKNTWIDRGTRAVFIDFATYSPNVNLFCVVKLVAEFPPSGGVVTSSHFTTLKLFRYLNIEDYLVLACEIVFIIMVLYFTVEKCHEIRLVGRKWFFVWWNLVDAIIIGISFVVVALGIYLLVATSNELKTAVKAMEEEEHYCFDWLVEAHSYFNAAVAVLVFLVWIKLLRFMALSKTTHHLQLSFAKCLKHLFGLAVASVILMLAFAQLGQILFGMEVEEFSTLGKSLVTLLLILVGYFDYQKIENDRRTMGAIYLFLYIVFVPLLLISLFIAVVVFAYTEVGRSVFHKGNEVYLVDVIRVYYKKMLTKCCRRNQEKQRETEEDKTHVYENNYKNITDMLWRAGFNDEEIDQFLNEYSIKKDQPIESSQLERMATDIDRRKAYMKKKRYKEVSEELEKLNKKINDMNEAINKSDERLNLVVETLLAEHERVH